MKVSIVKLTGLLLLFCLFLCSEYAVSQTFKSKKSGVCFRFDDYQDAAKLDRVRLLFNKYGYKFTYSANSGIAEFYADSAYWKLLQNMASDGHEIADQSPTDVSHYFEPPTSADALKFSSRSGVDHVNSDLHRVCLEYSMLSTAGSGDEGKVDVRGNMVISKTAGEFAFSKLINTRYTTHFYLPSQNKLVYFYALNNAVASDPDTAFIQTFWKEPLDLGNLNNIDYRKITPYETAISKQGLQVMAEYSIGLFLKHNLAAPTTFIHPGGAHPYATRQSLREALTPLGYLGGATYPVERNGITDYNPDGSKQFNLQGGDFTPEFTSLAECKRIICEKYAKNQVAVSINHLNSLGGAVSFDQMMQNLEDLLIWLKARQIPVDTYKNWNLYLTSDFYDQTDDVFPPLQNDFDGDSKIDGIAIDNLGLIDKNNGISYNANYCFATSANTPIFYISELMGLNRGKHTITVSTKGGKDIYDYFNLIVYFPEINQSVGFPVYTNTAAYTERNFDFEVPEGVTYLNISLNYNTDKSQKAYITGFKLRSAKKPSIKPHTVFRLATDPYSAIDLSGKGACNGYTQNQLVWSVLTQPKNFTATVSSNVSLHIIPNSNRFRTGIDSLRMRLRAPDNTADTAWLYIRSVSPFVCKGMVLNLAVYKDSLNDKSYAWSALPADASMTGANTPVVSVKPSQNTTYSVDVTLKNNSVQTSTLALSVLTSKISGYPSDLKRFNGANSLVYSLGYDKRFTVQYRENPQKEAAVTINGSEVTVARDAAFKGNLEVKLLVVSPSCEAYEHTLYATTFATGQDEFLSAEELSIYPNPTSGIIHVEGLPENKDGKWSLIDLSGKVILSDRFDGVSSLEIKSGGIPDGFYLLSFVIDDQVFTKKILISYR